MLIHHDAATSEARRAATVSASDSVLAEVIRTPMVVGVPLVPAVVLHPDRLLAVVRSGLLDTGPEAGFDDLVALARDVVGGDCGFFTVVDAHRSFWKSAVGVDVGGPREERIEDSVCQVVVATGAPLVVEDARRDVRTRHLGAVTELGIGACVGYPVRDGGGQVIGGLCVMSSTRRRWNAREQRAMATLAGAVSAVAQLRRVARLSHAQVDALETDRDEQARLARSLQDSLLPPLLPAIPGVDAAAAYLPAGHGVEVVGDFYDLFEVDGHWCAVMGDVVGHGVEAAKLTALARYTVRTEAAHRGAKPSEVLGRLHEALLAQHDRKLVTVALAALRPGPEGVTGGLCSAGHEPPLIRRADGRIEVPPTRGQVLGATTDVVLEDTAFELRHGDALVLYTDGVTESRAGRRAELFGDERLAEVLSRRCDGLNAEGILDQVLLAVAEHSGGYRSDDTAIMVVLA